MKRFVYLYICGLLLLSAGCQQDKPKPETKLVVQPVTSTTSYQDIPVLATMQNSKEPFLVQHHVRGKNVFIECFVPGITFRETNASNQGKIILYVNGKKKEYISSAAFIVKGLSSGTHRIKLEVIKGENPAPMMEKEFYVSIP